MSIEQELQIKLDYLYACRNIWQLLSITGANVKPKT